MGEASYILGIRIFRDRKNKMIDLSQASYIDKVLEHFAMTDAKSGAQCNSQFSVTSEQWFWDHKSEVGRKFILILFYGL